MLSVDNFIRKKNSAYIIIKNLRILIFAQKTAVTNRIDTLLVLKVLRPCMLSSTEIEPILLVIIQLVWTESRKNERIERLIIC